ncbi:MAG: murein hydrolase activator EnvC [Ilumatobacter sp.]
MLRRAVISSICILFALADPGVVAASTCWLPPVSGIVIDPFRAPECPYCAGNRGIEYSTERGQVVRAVAAGQVTWSGSVAGVRYVVVTHANGWRATYGDLASTRLRTGDAVVARQSVGRSTDRLHFGLRVGHRYRDPSAHLGRLVGRPRLVPIDGSMARTAPAPRLRCGRQTLPIA